jgi:hypothetical protein
MNPALQALSAGWRHSRAELDADFQVLRKAVDH